MKKNRTSPSPAPRSRPPRLRWSAAVGLAAAIAVTVLVDTARHAVLAKNAGTGPKFSPSFTLTSDFAATFVLVTAAVYIISAMGAARRARRATGQAGAPAARRSRRAAARGW